MIAITEFAVNVQSFSTIINRTPQNYLVSNATEDQ